MKYINNEYYIGFEGEPEIQFICKKENDTEVFVMWEGYFDQIMSLIKPDREGWKGLAYYYNMYLGWYEESPWIIQDLHMALKQFETIENQITSEKTNKILKILCDMFRNAILNEFEVSIARE